MRPRTIVFLFLSIAACSCMDTKAAAPNRAMTPTEWLTENSGSTDTSQQTVQFVVNHASLSTVSEKPVCWLHATADGRFRVQLGPAVIASMKRLGIVNVSEHFKGKRVTIRGQTGFLLPPSIHAEIRPTIYLHVNSVDNFDSVVAAKPRGSTQETKTKYPFNSPFADYPVAR